MPTQELVAACSSSTLRVTVLQEPAPWRDFLERKHSGTLYHRLEWDRVFQVYGLQVIRLIAWRDDRVVGVLPLVCQRSWVFGRRLTSLPWFDTAGVMCDDASVREALTAEALQISRRLGATGLLVRQAEPVENWPQDRSDKVLMRLALVPDPDKLWKSFSPKVRNQVRKGEKGALTAATVGPEHLADFSAVYSENMRDLGSPGHSRKFFATLLDAFGSDAQIHVARLGDQVIGAGITLNNGKCLEIPWASSFKRYNSLCVNHVMYWHILRQACEKGFELFHFGRSSVDSGTYHFKKQWGAEPKPLWWYQLSADGSPVTSTKALQEGYGWATKVWRRLPLWLTRLAGPHIVSKLP